MFILVEPLEPKSESLQGPYPGPANKYSIINIKPVLLSLYTAIGPVHEKPPLRKGWHKARDINIYSYITLQKQYEQMIRTIKNSPVYLEERKE